MARIIRPRTGRLLLYLPFRANGGNYRLLRDICGERTKPEWNPTLKRFEVARAHLEALIARLPNELGASVHVELQGASQTKCVEACWRDAKQETWWQCVCSCAGRYHGTGTPPPKALPNGLYVATEYTSETFVVQPT